LPLDLCCVSREAARQESKEEERGKQETGEEVEEKGGWRIR